MTAKALFMSDGLLNNIIRLEKNIQAEVDNEQKRASEWQARELLALQGAFAAAKAGEEQRFQQRLAEREEELRHEGAAIEAAALTWSQRLEMLSEATLRSVLKRHLATILPGGDYDHPHGQS
jgi:hypothetical protein